MHGMTRLTDRCLRPIPAGLQIAQWLRRVGDECLAEEAVRLFVHPIEVGVVGRRSAEGIPAETIWPGAAFPIGDFC